MSDNLIITIGRQFCSGGLEIGKKVAEKLGIDCYDKELIGRAAKESGLSEDIFEMADEKPSNSFLYSIVMGSYYSNSFFFPNDDVLTNDKLFGIQSKAIKELSKEKSCVIVGRCSDYILREEKRLLRVYLWADMDKRIERFKKVYPEKAEQIKDIEAALKKMDKKRAAYYEYYTGNTWDNVKNYDLIINTAKFGYENAVDKIVEFSGLL
ncbi:MAG: cytidylate kinase-like family protein [Firmicutes bacterium]|nr:cytidylate kinase-like family protein [Bacillota bacterium]